MRHFLLLTVFLFCSVTYVNEILALDISRGMILSNSCAACHGTDGKSPGAIPSIYRKSAKFIVQALHDFQDGKRPATVMGWHAAGYSDEEIRLIANYFSSRP